MSQTGNIVLKLDAFMDMLPKIIGASCFDDTPQQYIVVLSTTNVFSDIC